MGNLDSKQIQRAKEYLEYFQQTAHSVEMPEETNAVMVPNFTTEWLTYLLMGICSRESHFGLLLSDPKTGRITGRPDGTGDGGYGLGLMQIDKRYHPQFYASGDWKDPEKNISYGCDVWVEYYNYISDHFDLVDEDYARQVWAATAAYNCGPGNVAKALRAGLDVDARTTGRDYSADVRSRMKYMVTIGLVPVLVAAVPKPPVAPEAPKVEEIKPDPFVV